MGGAGWNRVQSYKLAIITNEKGIGKSVWTTDAAINDVQIHGFRHRKLKETTRRNTKSVGIMDSNILWYRS